MALDRSIAHAGPLEEPGRRRFVVTWQNPETRRFESIGVLEAGAGQFQFTYLPVPVGQPTRLLPGFPERGRTYSSRRLFLLFAQRLMNPNRADYGAWLEMLGLPPDAAELDVLGRSQGRRLGDNIGLVPEPPVEPDGVSHATFFVHGLRHRAQDDPRVEEALAVLRPGEALRLTTESSNPINPLAITVCRSAVSLGYVPDPLVTYANLLLDAGEPAVSVLQVNGDQAPPNLRLLVAVRGRMPAGRRPFDDL
jgi:hypothetical protein